VTFNYATRTVTIFAVPPLGIFFSGFQHSVSDIFHKVIYSSVYKTSIQNMDEMFTSGIMLAYPTEYNFIFGNLMIEDNKITKNFSELPFVILLFRLSKNISILLADNFAEKYSVLGEFFVEISNPYLCRLENGLFSQNGHTILMLHRETLISLVTEFIDRVIKASLYKY
jgi:hypothetical protein